MRSCRAKCLLPFQTSTGIDIIVFALFFFAMFRFTL